MHSEELRLLQFRASAERDFLKTTTGINESNSYLLENEVGVWNFTEGAYDRGTKVRRIEFQDDVSVEPEAIEDLALLLYNDVIRDQNHIASIKFNARKEFTPRDIAESLSINVDRVRRKLKEFGINPTKGNRYSFDKREFNNLCQRLNDEFKSKTATR